MTAAGCLVNVSDELPAGVGLVRTTKVFDSTTVPDGLRRAHRIADGVWGRLVVSSGELTFVFEDDATSARRIGATSAVVIPPGRLHHVEIDAPVTFAIEFYR